MAQRVHADARRTAVEIEYRLTAVPTLPALEVSELSKSFGGVHALDGVDLRVESGEVHGLLGENGSGKSTLIKVLAGYHAPDSGELRVYGEPVKLPLRPGQFRSLGMDFVHQDLGLIPSLSVIENLYVGELTSARHGLHISWTRERRRAAATFDRYGLKIDVRAKVAELTPVERALLAIVRAVEGMRENLDGRDHGGILVLDEPTVFLPRTGIDALFTLVREIAASGSSVIFVSHDLDEVREITDRTTVLRDGHVVGTVVTAETSEAELVRMIIGRHLETLDVAPHDLLEQEVGIAVEGLTGGTLRNVSIELHEGEVLGLTGLVGSGFEEVPYFLFGAWRPESGRLRLPGSEIDLTSLSPARALAAGVALVPADRQQDGVVGSLPVYDNILLRALSSFFRGGVLRRLRMLRHARQMMGEFDVRPADPRIVFSSLSGGNQQKALLAKWLYRRPRLLLLHEPTQGVDVGARQQIFSLVREAAGQSMSVICASSDYEQLAAVCDRVLILARGRIVDQLVGDAVTKERITERCYNSVVLSEEMTISV
jgi:ribose transport system ATP-binding protein